ncbi:MAG: hypothetical protein IJD96_00610 [Lachnospiraceae bacterium]|nr:hypothetical protein [Lachnospiraceae bacterium]
MAQNVTTKLEDLNLTDRFLFDETMENREAYEATVSILLENEIELLERPETEKEFRVCSEKDYTDTLLKEPAENARN